MSFRDSRTGRCVASKGNYTEEDNTQKYYHEALNLKLVSLFSSQHHSSITGIRNGFLSLHVVWVLSLSKFAKQKKTAMKKRLSYYSTQNSL